MDQAPTITPMRERILEAAQTLLVEEGPEGVTNRAVAAAARTQPPVIYRLFEDKQGLLDAVAERVFAEHLVSKAELETTEDAVADLRTGWDQHVAFGLANPAVYVMVYGDVRPGQPSAAAEAAQQLLAGYVHRAAASGRLRVPEPLAVQMMHAAGRGATLTLIQTPEAERDLQVSTALREATLAAIITAQPIEADAMTASAISLRAGIGETDELTAAERSLMVEWLDRLSAGR